MGLRFRLKADFDTAGFSEPIRVILTAFKKYGIIVADNGGDWFISGAPDDRWDDDLLRELRSVTGDDFEAVLTEDANGDPIYPGVERVTGDNRSGIDVWPNPFQAVITIWVNPIAGVEKRHAFSLHPIVGIYQIDGRLMEGVKIESNRAVWNTANSPPGIYILRARANGRAFSRRIILNK